MSWILTCGLALGALTDLKFRRIPNVLTFSLMGLGFMYSTLEMGPHGLVQSALGIVVGTALLFIPFILGGTGGGDVKLLAAIGSFAGPVNVAKIFLAAAIFGGIFSLIEAARHGQLKSSLKGLKNRVLFWMLTKNLTEIETNRRQQQLHIPYAIPLGCGWAWFMFQGA